VLGIQPRLDLPGVGRNLHDHPAIYLQYEASAALDAAMNDFVADGHTLFTEQSLAKLQSDHCTTAFDLHFYPCSNPTADVAGHWAFVWPVANMTPHSRGAIRLRSADPAAAPIIDPGYLTDPDDHDVAVLLNGIAQARQIMRQTGVAEQLGSETPVSARVVDRESVRRACLHYYHPVGSCKMGSDRDPLAVVNARGQVYGLENLYVGDASIMPVIPRANTNLPALVVAERIASWL
jgi:choline dehydrogenase